VLVKSGFYTDRKGNWKSKATHAWYNRYWEQGELFNKWITKAMGASRLSRSNVLSGGLMAIHREAYRRVSFDPWIPRGEDLDYLLNIRMYGGGVWFDNKWSVQHLPPTERNEAQRFKQDIYRWIYEHRKLEFSKTQIDLLRIQPHSLDPYPGPFLENSITTRVFVTALLRTIGRAKDRQGYFKAAQAARREAKAYAEMFCAKYFEFQLGWAQILAAFEADPQLKALFSERSRVTVGGSPAYSEMPLASSVPLTPLAATAEAAVALAASSAQGMPSAQMPGAQMPSGAPTAGLGSAGIPSIGADSAQATTPRAALKPDLFDFDLDFEALGIDIDDD
jgi:hypothetical protein